MSRPLAAALRYIVVLFALLAILEESKTALDEAGIQLPSPHLQLFIDGVKALEPLLPKVERGRSEF